MVGGGETAWLYQVERGFCSVAAYGRAEDCDQEEQRACGRNLNLLRCGRRFDTYKLLCGCSGGVDDGGGWVSR